MEGYFTAASEDSPSIMFDAEKGFIEIVGKSLPENANACYNPLFNLVKEYIKSPQQKTTVNLRLLYLNSSSAKKILEIITLLECLPKQGYDVDLLWHYNANDEDMHEEGEEFKRMTDLQVTLISEE
ncbi:MAG TPA: nuclear pore complex subunit [Bacteroidales bacterium]|nr:nuclear pore complex subunit [Bacteroidales bacterium]